MNGSGLSAVALPFTVTLTGPYVALTGTVTVRLVAVAAVTVARTAPK